MQDMKSWRVHMEFHGLQRALAATHLLWSLQRCLGAAFLACGTHKQSICLSGPFDAPHQGITAAAATTHQAFSHSALALTSVYEGSRTAGKDFQPTPSTLSCVHGLQSSLLMP